MVTRPDGDPAVPGESLVPAGPAHDGHQDPRGLATRSRSLASKTRDLPGKTRGVIGKTRGVIGKAGRMIGRAGHWVGRWPSRRPARRPAQKQPPKPGLQPGARPARTWPLSRINGVAVVATALLAVLSVVVGSLAIAGLSDARGRLLTKLDPATFQALRLDTALVNQETGVRGYALSAQQSFLAPYTTGVADEKTATASLRTLLAGERPAEEILAQVGSRAAAWRAQYAEPTIRQVQTAGKPTVGTGTSQGKAVFDSLRRAVAILQRDIAAAHSQGEANLRHASTTLVVVCIAIAVMLVLVVVVLALGLRAAAIGPLSRLAAEARRVAGGDFRHEVEQAGPREVRELAADVNRMRRRILRELSALQASHADLEVRSRDLQRSNSELEQFAYVASHDLQEPLRKVASFCQLLQRRYAGQLDERANQYIDLAVDGAKRMQELITDLLTFSRVGRDGAPRAPVPLAAALGQAMANLSTRIEATGATIEVGALPVVQGEESLLIAVFQNLLSNALKFRGPQPPHIAVSATKDEATKNRAGENGAGENGAGRDATSGDRAGSVSQDGVGDDRARTGSWLVTVSDNGIGISPEFADRIFVIFQRLHGRDRYPGTGIGLAMCRKIIEYHGGRIWLDTSAEAGSRLCFTLPVMQEVGAKDD